MSLLAMKPATPPPWSFSLSDPPSSEDRPSPFGAAMNAPRSNLRLKRRLPDVLCRRWSADGAGGVTVGASPAAAAVGLNGSTFSRNGVRCETTDNVEIGTAFRLRH